MKTIGLLGGMTWESSLEYYRIINQEARKQLEGLHSAKIVLYSVDFYEIDLLQRQGNWQKATDILVNACCALERAGVDFIVMCTNTMHKLAEDIQTHISLPLLHIAEATGTRIVTQGLQKVALLGTRFTMEEDFYKGKLGEDYHLKVIVPEKADRETIHTVIFQELCHGIINPSSKESFLEIIGRCVHKGAEGVILGCTEIPLLISAQDVSVPVFDTTTIHAQKAFDYAIT